MKKYVTIILQNKKSILHYIIIKLYFSNCFIKI